MSYHLLISVACLGIGIALMVVAMRKDGNPPNFLRNGNLRFLYPILPLLFLVIGFAELIRLF
ncbi:MAG TPA: hypothetical protein VIL09_01835 [Microvirga sp.]|jgi:hypothetical protein